MVDDFTRKVGGTDPIDSTQPVKGFQGESQPGKSFESYMQTPASNASQQAGPTQPGVSPAQLTQQTTPMLGSPTMQSVLAQMNTTSSSLGDLQSKLQTPNLTLKSSQKYLLRNKLTEANSQIRSAATKAGVEVGALPDEAKNQNPVVRFLSLVTDGQRQMMQAQQKVSELNEDGQTMNPGQLLMIQVKLSKAQQELEYSSIVLNNAISAVKMLFNVQL
ncbi:MAG: hypothetical protein HY860_05995 [Chlamydiales bacterium]|nr:hypothetical protein [Chlamydiales bacterium]